MNLGISPEPRTSFTKQRISSVLSYLQPKALEFVLPGMPSKSRAFPFGSPFNFLPNLLQLDLLSVGLAFWTFDTFLSIVLRHSALLDKLFSSAHGSILYNCKKSVNVYMHAFPLALS
jgi:hypothetical protein